MSARVHRGTSRKPRPPRDEVYLAAARVRAGATGHNGVFADARMLADELDALRARVAELEERDQEPRVTTEEWAILRHGNAWSCVDEESARYRARVEQDVDGVVRRRVWHGPWVDAPVSSPSPS